MNNRIHILNELEEVAPILVPATSSMPYTLPIGYFENFAANLMAQVLVAESQPLSPLFLHASRKMPHHVPVGYFESFSNQVIIKIHETAGQENVPSGYFESLPDLLLSKIHGIEVQQELEMLAPILNTIDKRPVNAVPTNYFETLAPATVPVVAAETTVDGIKKNRSWIKWAAAACVTGIIAFAGINAYQHQLATAEQVAMTNITDALSKVSDTTIENYLTKENLQPDMQSIAYETASSSDGGYSEVLQQFSEEELQQYLQSEGEAVPNN